jgi:hypothetical protein
MKKSLSRRKLYVRLPHDRNELIHAKEPLRRCLIGLRRRRELAVAGFSIGDVGSGWFSIRFEVLERPFSGLQTHYAPSGARRLRCR